MLVERYLVGVIWYVMNWCQIRLYRCLVLCFMLDSWVGLRLMLEGWIVLCVFWVFFLFEQMLVLFGRYFWLNLFSMKLWIMLMVLVDRLVELVCMQVMQLVLQRCWVIIMVFFILKFRWLFVVCCRVEVMNGVEGWLEVGWFLCLVMLQVEVLSFFRVVMVWVLLSGLKVLFFLWVILKCMLVFLVVLRLVCIFQYFFGMKV